MNKAKPFLMWPGGKTQLLKEIEANFPTGKNDTFTYIEPFVGAGAVLFWVLNNFPNLKSAVINDVNEDLTNTYKTVKSNVTELISILKTFETEYHSLAEQTEERKEYYYTKRKLFNTRKSDQTTQSALFIFLNKTCFNGLYRVNRKNEFNVSIGRYKKPMICDENNLLSVSKLLQNVEILTGDFEQTANYTDGETVFYFDPPYKPLTETSSFTGYSKNRFNDNEQIRVKEFCDTLDGQNHKWLLSNSDVKNVNPDDNFFENMYGKYQINRVLANRHINSVTNTRKKVLELLISNQ